MRDVLLSLPILTSLGVAHDNRTGGSRGGSAENLRGTTGARFEGRGKIHRGAEGVFGFCCFGGGSREDNKERFFLIKGPFCFVFASEDAPSAKYVIGLQNMCAIINPAGHDLRVTVLLENHFGDQEYEFSFESEKLAKRFKAAVEVQASSAEVEAVRKRLGHEHLILKRSSIMFAETIAMDKVSAQPDLPVSMEEVFANMPTSGCNLECASVSRSAAHR
jgi:hypothetical protein